jgi:hypothetical protein
MYEYLEYLVGQGSVDPNQTIWVGYRPRGERNSEEAVCVSVGPICRDSETYVLPPAKMLERRPFIQVGSVINGRWQTSKSEQESPGWFGRKCHEANCEWFVPMVKRMAGGEHVPLEEIQAAYLAHNGKPMPCGDWIELFR